MSAVKEVEKTQMPELEQVLAYHNGNTIAAIETLLKDCRHLREQLSWAGCALSVGYTRGWRPVPDRD
ncbi:hypothetical protein ASG03_19105 [Rhizobium sp. Leaf341]|nr:hypothetical protein [Rhizobium sp. Leaf341]KQR75778.1 hypothetical protein ASG03_19105 [Rhizobium sp. Leaf341]